VWLSGLDRGWTSRGAKAQAEVRDAVLSRSLFVTMTGDIGLNKKAYRCKYPHLVDSQKRKEERPLALGQQILHSIANQLSELSQVPAQSHISLPRTSMFSSVSRSKQFTSAPFNDILNPRSSSPCKILRLLSDRSMKRITDPWIKHALEWSLCVDACVRWVGDGLRLVGAADAFFPPRPALARACAVSAPEKSRYEQVSILS
jgi:hypothetical protein